MSAGGPFRGAFRHQHGDPQSLRERIDAQLRERIAEAVEMAALELMVEARKRQQRALPEESNSRDRAEFHAIAEEVLEHLHRAFRAALAPADLEAFEAAARAEAGDAHAQRLSGQVLLAKRLPDYWQRFEAHRAELAAGRLGAVPPASWLKRLFRG
jgi:hypothetical protein